MDELYPKGPESIPLDLTKPSSAYARHAWTALGGLTLFMALYAGLVAWFSWTAYRLLGAALTGNAELEVIAAGIANAFFAIFLVKALVFFKRGREAESIEITAEDEPVLFAFLDRLVTEAGAPKPHRVFLSHDVNAAVFYDLNLLNLILPTKKNLVIGVGLINVLTLGELKAVLAHEFGHFAQRSMAVGRWVYMAQQIAHHVVARRDALDGFLRGLSWMDLRIAWIGWLLRGVIWSLRSTLDIAFRLVVLAERALSREMEYQADLVAVALTGSDPLVNALHRLHAADQALDTALQITGGQLHTGHQVQDLYALQTRALEKMREVLDDDTYGRSPVLPAEGRDRHRVFSDQAAQPPRMWATHPPNHEREANAKRRYVPNAVDDRPAWMLFRDPEATRRRATDHVTKLMGAAEREDLTPLEGEDCTQKLDERFDRAYFDRRFRGAYLNRSCVRDARTSAELMSTEPVQIDFDALYPESLIRDLQHFKDTGTEKATLEGLRDGRLKTVDGVIRHRGAAIKAREIPDAIAEVEADCVEARAALAQHDRRCRSVHAAAAAALGDDWATYHRSLVQLLHYADHTEANLKDAAAHLSNVVDIALADGRVSAAERRRMAASASDMYHLLQSLFDHRDIVTLPKEVADEMELEQWSDALPDEFELLAPSADNIGDWLEVIDSWLNAVLPALDVLERVSLETLLRVETEIEAAHRAGQRLGAAPSPARVPDQYPALPTGQERELQTRLDLWDRFHVAEGLGPSLARTAVAGTVVGAVLLTGFYAGTSKLVIYNGLATPVQVTVGERQADVPALDSTRLEMTPQSDLRVQSRLHSGEEIEQFTADMSDPASTYVYNVASATPLIEWTANYGAHTARPPRSLGVPRWLTTTADHVFTQPPESISSSGSGATRTVLEALGGVPPAVVLRNVNSEEDAQTVIRAHGVWDPRSTPFTSEWLVAAGPDLGREIVSARLKRDPLEIISLRVEQALTAPEELEAVCDRHRALAAQHLDNRGLTYLAVRCDEDSPARDARFVAEHKKTPDAGWLAFAAGFVYAERTNWKDSERAWSIAFDGVPEIRSQIGLSLARVCRVAETCTEEKMARWARNSTPLQRLLQRPSEGAGVAYVQLFEGKLAAAVKTAEAAPDLHRHVLRLAAASDGAPEDIVEQALALSPDDDLQRGDLFVLLGLAARHDQDVRPYLEKIKAAGVKQTFEPFTEPRPLAEDPAAMEAALSGFGPELRGHAYVVAIVAMGEDAPAAWRRHASRLLLFHERPWFRTDGAPEGR